MATATAVRTPRKKPKAHQVRDGARPRATRQEARRAAIPRDGTRRAADLLKMVADPTRLRIVLMLAERERTVTELCADLGAKSQPAISHHLSLLRHSAVVMPQRDGKNNIYSNTDLGRTLARLAAPLVEGPS